MAVQLHQHVLLNVVVLSQGGKSCTIPQKSNNTGYCAFHFFVSIFSVGLIFKELLKSEADNHLFAIAFFFLGCCWLKNTVCLPECLFVSLIFLLLWTSAALLGLARNASFKKNMNASLTSQVRTVLQFKPGLFLQCPEADSAPWLLVLFTTLL